MGCTTSPTKNKKQTTDNLAFWHRWPIWVFLVLVGLNLPYLAGRMLALRSLMICGDVLIWDTPERLSRKRKWYIFMGFASNLVLHPHILAKTCLYTDMESNILYHPEEKRDNLFTLIFNFTGHLDKNVFRQKGPFKLPRFRSRQGRKRNETATKPLADIPLHWFGSWRDPYFMAQYNPYRTG